MVNENFDIYKKMIDDRLSSIYKDGPSLIKDPINYVIKGGKRLRPILCMLTNEACHGKLEDALSTAVSIELLHIFSLIHDDIMDDDCMRHGTETIHNKWNISIGILSGDAILALAFKELNASSNLIKEKFNSGLIAVCEGQALDLEYEKKDFISLDDYFEMINLKTSHMLGLSAELGSLVTNSSIEISESLRKFGLLIGKAFQVQDDLLEVVSSSEIMGKTLLSDIVLNKKTYLFIKANEDYPNELNKIYKKNKNNDNNLNSEIRTFLYDTKIIEDCKQCIELIFDELNRSLKKIDIKKNKLRLFINNIRNRKF